MTSFVIFCKIKLDRYTIPKCKLLVTAVFIFIFAQRQISTKMVSNKGLHCKQNVEGKVISGTTTTKTLMDSDPSIVHGMSKKTK